MAPMLRQLKGNGDVGREVNCLPIPGSGAEADLLGDMLCLFVEPMAQSVHDTLHQHVTTGGERDTKDYVTLHLELASLCRITHRGFG